MVRKGKIHSKWGREQEEALAILKVPIKNFFRVILAVEIGFIFLSYRFIQFWFTIIYGVLFLVTILLKFGLNHILKNRSRGTVKG